MGWYDDWLTIPTSSYQEDGDEKLFKAKPKLYKDAPILIEMFAGGGGVAAGAVQAGIRPAIAIEFDPGKPQLSASLANAHDCNFKEYGCKTIRQTVQQLADADFPGIPRSPDFLHASPVCSNFSAAKRKDAVESMTDLTAANAVAKAIAVLLPQNFTLENVPTYQYSKSFDLIILALQVAGYSIEWDIFNLADYGLPQARKRLILRASLMALPSLPEMTNHCSWYDAISELISDMPDSELVPGQVRALKNYLSKNKPCPLLIDRVGGRSLYKVKASELPANTLLKSNFTDQRGSNRNKWADIWLPIGTVKSVNITAAARLQGFPGWYEFPESTAIAGSIIGYSVPPMFMAQLFKEFMHVRQSADRDKPRDIENSSTTDEHNRNSSADASVYRDKNQASIELLEKRSLSRDLQFQNQEVSTDYMGRGTTNTGLPLHRHHLDFYESPHWFVTDTLRHVQVSGVVGECCIGGGAIAFCLSHYPQITKVWTNDVDPEKEADYHADATQEWDFPEADWIVTNPPYGNLAAPIIKRAYDHAKCGVIMFLRHTWDEPCEDRAEWLATHPPTRKLIFPRYKFRKDGEGKRWASDSSTISAFVWNKAIACQPSLTRPAPDIWGFHDNPENAPSLDAIAQWIKTQSFDVDKTSLSTSKAIGSLCCVPIRRNQGERWLYKYSVFKDGKWRSQSKHVPKHMVAIVQEAKLKGSNVEQILRLL